MSTFGPTPVLYVEGKDDISVINALLLRHGIDTDRGKRYLRIQDQESVEQLLANMPDAIRNATDRPVGFVLDIDVPIVDRWAQVLGRLREAGVDAPETCPANGLIGQLAGYPHQIGVWLMPDCATSEQMMEHLLETLVPEGDLLWPHAVSSVDGAQKLGAKFIARHLIKAQIHTWVAWQESPGMPLGAAMNAAYFKHNSPTALAFLKWLRELYNLDSVVPEGEAASA